MDKTLKRKEVYDIEDLLSIMKQLRAPGGCPWDREQDHHSIRNNFLEEAYEAVEAIDREDTQLLQEELGDVLLQVVFHSAMEEEKGSFTFSDVVDAIAKKLIVRHPHVFGDVQAKTSDQVLENWDEIKKRTKGFSTQTQSINDVPAALPALMRSQKIQSRAAKSGFDYRDLAGAVADLQSEMQEFSQELNSGNRERAAEELGDVLFSCVNVARFLKYDSEELLTRSCNRFKERFAVVERLACEEKIDLKTADLDLLNALWSRAKEQTGN